MRFRIDRKWLPLFVISGAALLLFAAAGVWLGARDALHAVVLSCSRMLYLIAEQMSFRSGALALAAAIIGSGAAFAVIGLAHDLIMTRRRERQARRRADIRQYDGMPVYFVRGQEEQAWTAGLFRARVYVSSEMWRKLTGEERTALLAHERAHAAHRDVAKRVLMDALRRLFYFIPLFTDVAASFRLGQEVRADRAALQAAGRRALCGLYLHASGTPSPRLAVGFSYHSPRLAEVLDGRSSRVSFSHSRLIMSTASAVLMLMLGFSAPPAHAAAPAEQATTCDLIATQAPQNFTPLVGSLELYAPSEKPLICTGKASC